MSANRTELSRLVAAAVVSHTFRRLLFTDPAKAIEDGYNGETFSLTPAERQLILSIVAEPPKGDAKTIQQFALRVSRRTCQLDAEADELGVMLN